MTAVGYVAKPVSRNVLVRAVEHALLAPSVHNTQPWKWRVRADAVELYADLDRHLVGTDPDRRDLVISCGAALHHLRVVLAAAGVAVAVARLPDPEDSTLLAVVHIVADGRIDEQAAALAGAIGDRRSDRRAFAPEPAHPAQLRLLTACAAAENVRLVAVVGDEARARLAVVLGEAARRERATPGYAAELALWSGRYANSRDGLPTLSRTARGSASQGLGLRHFPVGGLQQSPQTLTGGPDGATLMVATTTGDEVRDWLRAGEATSAALLVATRIGLATTVLSQSVEVADTRRQLADVVLRVPENAQLVLRVGRAPDGAAPLPPVPRRPLRAVLISTNDRNES
ncbi:MAG TPA: NAD(P)H nitroreductase [Pseudonocardia sp.]